MRRPNIVPSPVSVTTTGSQNQSSMLDRVAGMKTTDTATTPARAGTAARPPKIPATTAAEKISRKPKTWKCTRHRPSVRAQSPTARPVRTHDGSQVQPSSDMDVYQKASGTLVGDTSLAGAPLSLSVRRDRQIISAEAGVHLLLALSRRWRLMAGGGGGYYMASMKER